MWKMGPAPRQKNHDTSMDGLAIVIRGNKATKNVSTGDLVLVENSTISGVSDGGYKALSNVSAGTAFTSANLSALSKGAVNALSDEIATLNGNLANVIKSKNYTGTTNQYGLIYPNNVPTGAKVLYAYTDYGTTALMQFKTYGFRAYNIANGDFSILANTQITITFYYFE